MMVR